MQAAETEPHGKVPSNKEPLNSGRGSIARAKVSIEPSRGCFSRRRQSPQKTLTAGI